MGKKVTDNKTIKICLIFLSVFILDFVQLTGRKIEPIFILKSLIDGLNI
jgi:hypothetical protein